MLAVASHKVGDPLAFYTVAATIIPVLFLALIYQATTLERLTPEWGAAAALVALVVVALGEVEALSVLASQKPSNSAQHVTMLSLIVLFLVVVLHPILRIVNRLPPRSEVSRPPLTKRLDIPRSDTPLVHALILVSPGIIVSLVVILLKHGWIG